MSELKELFTQRDEAFKTSTDEILATLATAIEGITKFLDGRNEVRGGNLSFEDVMLFSGMEENEEGYVMLVGVISYAPGQTFTLPSGEVVAVTDFTADYFRRMLRIGIPYKLAVEGSMEDIVKFMEETAVQEQEMVDAVDASLDEDRSEFDLSELTDEQKEALMLHMRSSGNKN